MQGLNAAENSKVLECLAIEAQPWCNFVLFEPTHIPDQFTLAKQQLRKESQDYPSSFRVVLEHSESRQQLSIKQFLYDWAPPAYDYPSLWLNTAKFSATAILAPAPVLIGERVLWVGKNYRGQNAATIDLARTRIEITFGNFNVEQETLIKIIEGLKPCNEVLQKQILQTPFAMLSYYYRYQKKASNVPLSFWRHLRNATCQAVALVPKQKINHDDLPSDLENILKVKGYNLNSIFEIRTSEQEVSEKEYLFEHEKVSGVFIHVLATANHSAHPIAFPPQIGDQVCVHKKFPHKGKDIYLATVDEKYGNVELVFKDEKRIYLMIIRAAAWVTKAWALDLLK